MAIKSTASIFSRELGSAIQNQELPKRTVDARDWLRSQAQEVRRASPSGIISRNSQSQTNIIIPGFMYLFNYDPKTKADLPFYDSFPLVFPFKKLPDGFMGLNMHYLPLQYRARLMDALYDLSSNKRFDETTRLRLSYQVLNGASKFRYFEPCVKRYLNSHLKSRLLQIDSNEWDTALFLPLDRFQKAGRAAVYAESRRIIGRG
jgi:hypothetical protein